MTDLRPSVLITGASGDIGFAICRKFLDNGYYVYAQGHTQIAKLDGFSSDDVCVLEADLESEASISAMIAKMEDVATMRADSIAFPSTFVHAAGISRVGLVQDMSTADWDSIFAVNVRSALIAIKHLIPHMLKAEQSSIVFVSSFWGQLGASCEVAYSASKGALDAFTKSLAKELGPSNIRVNAIALGAIDTKMNAWMSSEEKEALCASIALGRMGTVEEAAEGVFFFASDKADYFNGQVVRMDGSYLGA